jgi:hypothetical protein
MCGLNTRPAVGGGRRARIRGFRRRYSARPRASLCRVRRRAWLGPRAGLDRCRARCRRARCRRPRRACRSAGCVAGGREFLAAGLRSAQDRLHVCTGAPIATEDGAGGTTGESLWHWGPGSQRQGRDRHQQRKAHTAPDGAVAKPPSSRVAARAGQRYLDVRAPRVTHLVSSLS